MAGFSDWLFGSPDRLEKVDAGTREQQALHNNILAQAMGMNQQGGGSDLANQYFNRLLGGNQQEAFNQFASPYMQQFQEQVLPGIAERFAGAGALSSSGFGQSLGGAASGLQAKLAQLFSELQGQAAQSQYGQFNQLSQQGLNYQPFQYTQREGSQGFLGNALGALGGSMFPIIGNALGQGIGGGISSLFKSKKSAGQPLAMGPAGLYPTQGNYNPFTG